MSGLIPTMKRFIPAGAGNGISGAGVFVPVAVHPRGCGERAMSVVISLVCSGSSPRVRGTEKPT